MIFCIPNISECRVIPDDDVDTKDSACISRFCMYQVCDATMLFTVSTRWSRDVTVAALIGDGVFFTTGVMGE